MLRRCLTISLLLPLFPSVFAQGPAQTVSGNPGGASYIATLPQNQSLPNGSLIVSSAPSGIGVSIQVSFSNLPTTGGPFREFVLPRNGGRSLICA